MRMKIDILSLLDFKILQKIQLSEKLTDLEENDVRNLLY